MRTYTIAYMNQNKKILLVEIQADSQTQMLNKFYETVGNVELIEIHNN